jgi:transcriptional antiterminator RfaH
MLRWYLIHTKPCGEMPAVANLRRQGYSVYLPQLFQTVRSGVRRCGRISALFPRYLFLHLHEGEQSLAPVASTVGVACIVHFGSRYAVVPDAVIHQLQERADPQSGLHHLANETLFTAGTPVRIAAGPFVGLEGLFQREAGVDRVIILLNLLGRHAPACVPTDCVARQSA